MRTHAQPLRAQLELALERGDALASEREELVAQVLALQRDVAQASRRASEATAAAGEAQRRAAQPEEDKMQAQHDLDTQRAAWARRWAERSQHQTARADDEGAAELAQAERQRGDAALAQLAALQGEACGLRAEALELRAQLASAHAERVDEWEPLRERWLGCEDALRELQDAHQATCDALAQAESRLADLDAAELSDPLVRASAKTSTSLLGELDHQRHRAVAQHRALVRDHAALKRTHARALASLARMRHQAARLAYPDADRVRRLEAALGEAEAQRHALMCMPSQPRASPMSPTPADAPGLVAALRAAARLAAEDRDRALSELRTAHLVRANEAQCARDLERRAAESDAALRRAQAELAALRCPASVDLSAAKGPGNEELSVVSPRPAKRRRTPSTASTISDASARAPGPGLNRGLKSCMVTLATISSANVADAAVADATISNGSAAEATSPTPDNAKIPATHSLSDGMVDEIHITPQTPIECNPQ
ncbi:hypothetical protein GGI02_005048 [Coemansia sp. RSA 2322]|nr:hypothetical protein GGI02_005048 [Coemansia sp. RSA 2322]